MKRGERGLGAKSRRILETAIPVVEDGAPMTVRGVAYKLLVRGVIPSMAREEVQKVSRLLVYAREHGLIPWGHIVDESREVHRVPSWDNIEDFSWAIEDSYRKDFWTTQPYSLQVWSEKSTVGGVIRPVTDQWGIPFMSVHGFGSATVVHSLATMSARDPREVIVLYVGDHDASGMHMSQVDLPERIARYGGKVTIRRIALTAADVPSLLTHAANKKDPRWAWYQKQYGDQVWELDAMDANTLRERIGRAIPSYIDEEAWGRMMVVEEAEKRSVRQVAEAMRAA